MFTRSDRRGGPQGALSLKSYLLYGAMLAAVGSGSPALAQDPDGAAEVEALVVTAPNYVSSGSVSATKTQAPLIETPQSITVISRDQIDLLNITSLQDSVRYTAGVTGENYGPDERYDWLTLRGFYPVQYIDGLQAPIGSVTNIGTDLYGFESVDILKGPASVLYGLSPPGGIVNMISRRPSTSFGGEIEGQLGEYEHKQIAGDITGPLGANMSGRLTALYRDRGTQVDFVDSKRTYIAPALTLDIAAATRITFLGYYQKDEIDGYGGGFLPASGTVLPNAFGVIPASRNLGEPDYNFYGRDQYGVGYDVSHQLTDNISLQQNLKYFNVESRMRQVYGAGLQADNRTVTRFVFPFNEDVSSFNIDSRVAAEFVTGALSHSVLVGWDYRKYDLASEFAFSLASPLDVFEPVYGAPVVEGAFFPFGDQRETQNGIYVQDQIRTGGLVVTLSGRQDWVETETAGSTREVDEFTYRVGVNYVFDNGIAPYVGIAKSFLPTPGSTFGGTPFEPSSGKQIEAGVKYDGRNLPEGVKLFATAAAYKITQENVLTNDPAHLFFSLQTGEVEVSGVELEAVARFHERLSINASYTKTNSEVTGSNGPDLGKQLPMVPEHKFSVLADYTIQTGPLAGLGGGIGFRYLGESYGDPANDWQNEAVSLWDAIVHYDTLNFRLALNANNLFDEIYVVRCGSAADCYYGNRRNVTVSLTRKF